MRAIVKGFVVWTLGFAVLFGSPAISLAQPRVIQQFRPQCKCSCLYAANQPGGWGLGALTFTPVKPNEGTCFGFTSFDRYFACKDQAGTDQAGQHYFGCQYIPGQVIQPGGILQKSP